MAGHSKWANIKHRKERADKKKGKVFSRIMKELISAVKQGGIDPKTNSKLRIAIEKAKEANIPQENIKRNIEKAASPNTEEYKEQTYELYGHGGVGILAEAFTDNKNRTVSELRIAINKCGGNLAELGAVSYNFEKKGVLRLAKEKESEVFELALELGAEDLEKEEEAFFVIVDYQDLLSVKKQFEEKNFKVLSADIVMLPKLFIECAQEDYEKNEKLIEWLENIEDIDTVFHNMKEL